MHNPPPVTKHQIISDELRSEMQNGKYTVGDRMPSEAQLVKRFNASRPTVARALRTLQEEDLIVRRAGSGSYAKTPDVGGQQISNRTLGLLIPDLGNTEIFQLIAGEIATLARVKDFGMIWGGSSQPQLDPDTSLQHGEDLCSQFINKRVTGVFFTPYELVENAAKTNRRIAQRLHDAGITVILLDRDLTPFPEHGGLDLIEIDNVAAGFLLAEHLIKLGCKTIRYVHPPRSASTIDARIAGVREAFSKHKINLPESWVYEGNVRDPVFVRKLIARPRPDAFICANDYNAAQLLQGLNNAGVKVPQEIKVVGFDDVSFANLVSPPLTTIHQPCRAIAHAALTAMMARIDEPTLPPRRISVAPSLVIRDSCGAYQPHKRPMET